MAGNSAIRCTGWAASGGWLAAAGTPADPRRAVAAHAGRPALPDQPVRCASRERCATLRAPSWPKRIPRRATAWWSPTQMALASRCRPACRCCTGPDGGTALDWYDDFVGIVVHPDEVLARREVVDEAGVVHRYRRPWRRGHGRRAGDAGWSHVASAGERRRQRPQPGDPRVRHKLDMRGKPRAPCQRLPGVPAGFMGLADTLRAAAGADLGEVPASVREQVALAERFGARSALARRLRRHSPAEFFAVACEAYFVNRERFAQEFPALMPLLRRLLQRPAGAASALEQQHLEHACRRRALRRRGPSPAPRHVLRPGLGGRGSWRRVSSCSCSMRGAR
jgi:Mlc titration factor MtfA (ptsG expression regulator)